MKNILIHLVYTLCVAFMILMPTQIYAGLNLGFVKSVADNNGSIEISCKKGTLLITPFTENIVRVTTIPNFEKKLPVESQSVILPPDAKYSVKQNKKDIVISFGNKNVIVVDKKSSLVSFKSGDTILLSEKDGITRSGSQQIVTFNQSHPGESFYGGGERGQSLDLSGDTLIMFNKQNYGYGKGDRTSQMNITVPFFISSRGYGVLFDDYTSSKLILGNPIEYITENRNPISYYFISGEDANIASVVKNYTLLTGRQELAPFWSLGYITSKYGYKTEEETLGVIDTLQQKGYPVDGIVLDLYWYGKETDMGRFQWNPQQWPTPEKMLSQLKSKGVKTVIISQPYLNKIGAIDNYNMAKDNGFLTKDSLGNVHDVNTWVGEAGMLDVSNKGTRDWMWSKYKTLTDGGVAGWWGDLGEPEVHPLTIRHANGETAAEYHNQYGNDWSKIIYDGFKKEYPNVRLMTLMRGGTAGLQRFSVFPWSTDVSRSWGGLQAQIPIMLNTAMSGLGYMSHDVGGFAVDPAHPTDNELYARWLQMGLFTPVLRTHSTVAAEPYHYTAPGYQDLFKGIVKSRYQWLPYNYTLAYENATTGAPFVRPMNFYDSTDKKLSDIEDQYMWGDEVLVAPVIEKDAIARHVILPSGVWYDYNNNEKIYQGPDTIQYMAPTTVIPIFIRGGSFIPLADYEMKSTEDYDPSKYSVWYYPALGKSKFTLYDDDRMSASSLKNGDYRLIDFKADNSQNNITISLASQGKGYIGMPDKCNIIFKIPGLDTKTVKVKYGNVILMKATKIEDIKVNEYYYDLQNDILTFNISWDYAKVDIEIIK